MYPCCRNAHCVRKFILLFFLLRSFFLYISCFPLCHRSLLLSIPRCYRISSTAFVLPVFAYPPPLVFPLSPQLSHSAFPPQPPVLPFCTKAAKCPHPSIHLGRGSQRPRAHPAPVARVRLFAWRTCRVAPPSSLGSRLNIRVSCGGQARLRAAACLEVGRPGVPILSAHLSRAPSRFVLHDRRLTANCKMAEIKYQLRLGRSTALTPRGNSRVGQVHHCGTSPSRRSLRRVSAPSKSAKGDVLAANCAAAAPMLQRQQGLWKCTPVRRRGSRFSPCGGFNRTSFATPSTANRPEICQEHAPPKGAGMPHRRRCYRDA